MSRVYFHSPSKTSELRGSERAYAGVMCNDLTLTILNSALRQWSDTPRPIMAWLPQNCYLHPIHNNNSFEISFRAWFNAGYEDAYLTDPDTGDRYPCFRIALNTTVVMGSRPIKLLARMHGQCEIHGYMEGEDRAFIAKVIEHGREERILRDEAGWEDVREHLLERDDEPVVMSYSVTESFPNSWVIEDGGIMQFQNDEEFYKLNAKGQWDLAMQGLRKLDETWCLRLKEETFDVQGFGEGMTAFQLLPKILDRPKVNV